jgi:DUF917 family protein
MGGKILTSGVVQSTDLAEKKGFTIGTIVLRSNSGSTVRIPVCNEYMLVLKKNLPLAVFPDLITVFDVDSSLPVGSADLRPGQRVIIFGVPRSRLTLSSTMRDRSLLRPIESLLRLRFPERGVIGFGRKGEQSIRAAP